MPIVATVYLSVLVLLSIVSDSARWCLMGSVVTSIITFIVYCKDKSAAVRKGWRVPEPSLNLLALVGGWPGAAVAQTLLRHKTKKVGFRVVYVIASFANVAINAGVIVWVWPS